MLVSLILTRKDSIPPTKVLIKSEIGNTRVTEYLRRSDAPGAFYYLDYKPKARRPRSQWLCCVT